MTAESEGRARLTKVIQLTVRGCGYVPGYGDHPGTSTLLLFVAMGAISGASRGVITAIVGAAAMLAVFGPMYLIGAYGRAKDAGRRALETSHDK